MFHAFAPVPEAGRAEMLRVARVVAERCLRPARGAAGAVGVLGEAAR